MDASGSGSGKARTQPEELSLERLWKGAYSQDSV